MKDINKKFKEYYKYLGYNGNQNIVCSENRDKVINIYKYPIIVALYEGKCYERRNIK